METGGGETCLDIVSLLFSLPFPSCLKRRRGGLSPTNIARSDSPPAEESRRKRIMKEGVEWGGGSLSSLLSQLSLVGSFYLKL